MGNWLAQGGSRDERAAQRYESRREQARQKLRRLLPNAVEMLSLLPSDRPTFDIKPADAAPVPVTLLGTSWIMKLHTPADTRGFVLPGCVLTTSGQILRFSRGYNGTQNELVQYPLDDPLHDPTFVNLEEASLQGLTLHTGKIMDQVRHARKVIGAGSRQAARSYAGEIVNLVVSGQQPPSPYQTLQSELQAVHLEISASVGQLTVNPLDFQAELGSPQSVT